MAKRGITKASFGSIAFSALFTTPILYLPLFSRKWRYKALPKQKQVKINLNFSKEDLPKVNKVIITKVPRFSTTKIHFSPSARFSSTITKKSYTISFNLITPIKPNKLTSIL